MKPTPALMKEIEIALQRVEYGKVTIMVGGPDARSADVLVEDRVRVPLDKDHVPPIGMIRVPTATKVPHTDTP